MAFGAYITDPNVFASISPIAILRYLRVNGWAEVRTIEGELIIFAKTDLTGKKQNLWMPISDQYADYVPMVARVVNTIAEVDSKTQLQLLDDFETIGVGDVVGLRAINPLNVFDHTLALQVGIDLLDRIRQMARAAAASALDKRAVHPRRPSTAVSQFVSSLRLGQTERGSYLIRVIAPLVEQTDQSEQQLPNIPGPEPFSRRATTELVRGLNAVKAAAEDNRLRGRFFFDPFLTSVPQSVSANLCEALAGRDSDDRTDFAVPLEISVTWSYIVQRSNSLASESIVFEPGLLPYIREAAREFRARNPEQMRLTGWVTILEREKREGGPGLIRLIAKVDRKNRSIRMQLADDDYQRAIDAHKQGSLVEVNGNLVVEKNAIYRLENPTGFQIVENDALFDLSEFD